MSIDISQFLDVFYEESYEGLAIMEQGLMGLDPEAVDNDSINAIFRVAHSIKGGAGTFGLGHITDFTHVLETLLDEVRDGQRGLSVESIDVMLRAVDCLNGMLDAAKQDSELDDAAIQASFAELNKVLDTENNKTADSVPVESTTPDAETASPPGRVWTIIFKPFVNLYLVGNDPVRIFREIEELGELTVKTDTSKLPDLTNYNPEDCLLQWELTLVTDAKKEDILEVFEWVEGECELSIKDVPPEGSETNLEAPVVLESASDEKPDTKKTISKKPSAPSPKAKKPAGKSANASENASIRVDIGKVDELINLVGEMVITQSMLGQLGEEFEMSKLEKLRDGLEQFERNTRELQESVMRIRMIPISFAFNRFPRMVRDVSGKMGKQVDLQIFGQETEVDKTVIEKISDPLIHLVRNAVDHGIEMPEVRLAKGKPEMGVVKLTASHRGGNVVIEITDDGAGLNKQVLLDKAIEKKILTLEESERMSEQDIFQLVFHAGFSTADIVSDISGRGVGMDVVINNIQELGGAVDITSKEGQGATFTVRLPLTLAILDGQTAAVGAETYIIPLASIVESIQIKESQISMVAGKGETFKLRDNFVPIIRLNELFAIETEVSRLSEGLLVIVESSTGLRGIFVDKLLGQQQVVIKSLDANYKKVQGFSGATILGDGSVALIIDIPEMLRLAGTLHSTAPVRLIA